jgi:putative ABC transport system ATP-binding protein
MPDDSTPLLEAQNVSKAFREGTPRAVWALQGVSLVIPRGSFSALTGPSGCGKTTLLALLGALERPSHGRVIFRARDLGDFSDAELARARRRMGFVFQDCSLIPSLSVWENITYPLIPRRISRGDRFERARVLLARFGLADKMLVRPKELSGGEQQRVAFARALAPNPEILLADEPTSNLDPEAADTVISILQEVHAEGRTIILATHEFRLASLADTVYPLERGTLQKPDA